MNWLTILSIGLSIFCLLLLGLLFFLILRRSKFQLDPTLAFKTLSEKLINLEKVEEKLKELHNFFCAPQTRGLAGEIMLEELIKSILPAGSYRFQHQFADGHRVDALIKIGSNYIPIDAKFPLEAFRKEWEKGQTNGTAYEKLSRQLSNLINEIAKKYIQPRQHTFPFALLYIPSEAIYYEGFISLKNNVDLFAQALNKQVIPVSPSSLYLYLSILVSTMRTVYLDQKQEQFIASLHQCLQEFSKLKTALTTSQNHLKNFNRAFEEVLRLTERTGSSLDELCGFNKQNA